MSGTSLEQQATAYLELRRKLGFALVHTGKLLLNFARYADRMGHLGPISSDLAVRWAQLPVTARRGQWARRLGIVRRFALYLAATDPRTEIPPAGLFGPTLERRAPYIYSEGEIAELLRAAASLHPTHSLRPHTYATLFALIACTGLRVSEALRLRRADVDLRTGVLAISGTKFHKSRLVPLHPSTAEALRRYAALRDGHQPIARTAAFFVSNLGGEPRYNTVCSTFSKLRNRLGWTVPGGRRRPRIHDLRHTFACRRLLAWYQEGVEIDCRLAALSTYLGHAAVQNTYWYLTAIPELMQAASARFERYGGRFDESH